MNLQIDQKSDEMSIDRRKSPKTKRYELGFHLAIDWRYIFVIPIILIIIYFSSANAIAYQNATATHGNNIHNKYGFDVKKNVAKSIYMMKSKNDTFIKNSSNYTDGLINYTQSDSANESITEISPTTNDDVDILITTTLPSDTDEEDDRNYTYYGQEENDTLPEFSAKFKTDVYTTDVNFEGYDVHNDTTEYSETTTIDSTTVEYDYYTEYISTTDIETEFTEQPFVDIKKINVELMNKNDIQKNAFDNKNITDNDYGDNETITKHLEFDSKKKLNFSEINKNCSACTAAINDTNNNKTESKNIQYQSTKGENNSSANSKNESESKMAAIKKAVHEENTKESVEATTEEDYNASYEIQEYEDGSKKTTTTTEQPQTGGPFEAIRDIAGTFIESIYERVVPKGLRDIFTRMQEQNEKLETIKLRSKEENGGLGQFGRSILKGLTVPLNQLMQGVRDYGSLDSDKNFFAGVASGVVTVADTVSDAFKDRVKAIYPGTLWCGDGDMARSAEVGLFFMTDSCCRRHDTCKHYITAGDTKYGLTNTGLFTRSHCECDKAFYRCLKRTNSLISTQIGLTYFSILGPQCFKREHPIMRCKRRTRYTGQKCEEYVLDHDQPKIWQWFDSETF